MPLDLLLLAVIIFAILLYKSSTSIKPVQSESWKRPCECCGKLTSLRCSRCHEAYYCSPEHMTNARQTHKRVCRKPLDALLFPVDGTAPSTIKIPYTNEVDTDQPAAFPPEPYHAFQPGILKKYLHGLEMKYVSRMGSNGPALERPLVVMYSSDWSGMEKNRCVAELTGGRMSVPWAGNVLVLRQKGKLYAETYESAKLEDVDAMKRFFEAYEDFVPYAF
ncbi:hypothetical protein C8R45DRAFT_820238 [Mycena sanguinolenta]|nr:hypothetical protein C8R45DRAFT_820238 [Mycena sanguinolenta]